MATRKTPMWRRYLTFWGRDADRDLRDEVEFHIEARIRELVDTGWTPDAARREALRVFGNPAEIQSECRRIDARFEKEQRMTGYLEDAKHDVRFALRQLQRQPTFWTVIVVTLVIGIAASTSIFAVVDGILLKPLAYPDPHRLVYVMSGTWKGVFVHLRDRSTTMHLAAYSGGPEITLGTDGEPVRLRAATVSPELFGLLGVPAAIGRTFTADEADPRSPAAAGGDGWRTYGVVVLSDGVWRTHFGASPQAVGRDIAIAGVPHTVIGVMPPTFDFPSRDTALWLPMSLDQANPFSLWSANALTLVGRLREGRDIGTARQETRTLIPTFRDLFPFYLKMPDGYGADAAVRPLHEEVVGDVRTELLILLAAIGAVLLILCVNVANLLLARGISRDRELMTRAALGAGRGRLIRQMLAENIAVALLSGAIGTIASLACLRMLVAFLPADLPRIEEIQIDARVLLFALGVSGVTGLAFGLLPAIRTTREGHGLLTRGIGGALVEGREGRLTGGLAALQFSCAVVLVVSAALLLQSLWNLTAVDPGFQVEGLVSARIAPSGSPDRLNEDLLRRLEGMPGVISTAVATSVPFGHDAIRVGFGIEGRPEAGNVPTVADVAVGISAGYLRTMGIPLLEGRPFAETDGPDSAAVAIVSRSLAKTYWGDETPVGSRIRLPEQDAPWRTIVGVVGDVKWSDLAGEDPRGLYLPLSQHDVFTNLRRVVIRTTDDPAFVAANLRGIVRSLDPDTAVSDIRTSGVRIGDSIARPRFAAYLLGGFAGIAMFLAAIGVYGVLSYAMNRRIPEIGVRLAFGASGGEVFGLLFRQGIRLTLIGIAIGIPAALGATQFLSSMLFGVEPVDPQVFATVAFVLFLIGLAVSYFPARRAARVDPMVALRQN